MWREGGGGEGEGSKNKTLSLNLAQCNNIIFVRMLYCTYYTCWVWCAE